MIERLELQLLESRFELAEIAWLYTIVSLNRKLESLIS